MEQLHNLLVDIRWAVRELNQHLERIEPTPSSAGEETESSPPPPGALWPQGYEYLKGVDRRLAALEKTLPMYYRKGHPPGPPSPPSGQRITAEGPPGVTISITTEAGLVADCTWTPTGITCTTRGTLLLPQPDQIPPGPVEFA
jgi:hypothetical protein